MKPPKPASRAPESKDSGACSVKIPRATYERFSQWCQARGYKICGKLGAIIDTFLDGEQASKP
jgi:hypothetical protein